MRIPNEPADKFILGFRRTRPDELISPDPKLLARRDFERGDKTQAAMDTIYRAAQAAYNKNPVTNPGYEVVKIEVKPDPKTLQERYHDWHLPGTKPPVPGFYETRKTEPINENVGPHSWFNYWDGNSWRAGSRKLVYAKERLDPNSAEDQMRTWRYIHE